MAKKPSIYDIVNKNKTANDIMADCYYDVENEDNVVEFISTNVISLNLLLSGKVNGGIPIGKISMISAPSMLGKSFVAMSAIKNAQKKGMNIVIIDTERTFNKNMAISLGIDVSKDKLFVIQDNGIERIIKFVLNLFENMTKEERKNTFVVFDSWGTLLTTKTLEDGLKGKDVMDMTDSKKKNKLANIILNTKATFFVINHVYDNIGGFGESLAIPGGRKIIFNSDCVILGMTRAKSKGKDEDNEEIVDGHIITAKTYKSRYCKENSKLKFKIKHDGGLDPFFGVIEDAIDGGFVTKIDGKPIKYSRPHIENDEKFKEDNIYNAKFWKPIMLETKFKEYLENKYTFSCNFDVVKEEKDIDEMFS
jgi:recombination protein RecA